MCPARLRNAGHKFMMILYCTILALPCYEAVGSGLDIGGVVFAVVGFLQFCGLAVHEEAAVLCRQAHLCRRSFGNDEAERVTAAFVEVQRYVALGRGHHGVDLVERAKLGAHLELLESRLHDMYACHVLRHYDKRRAAPRVVVARAVLA